MPGKVRSQCEEVSLASLIMFHFASHTCVCVVSLHFFAHGQIDQVFCEGVEIAGGFSGSEISW